jgi:DNA-binding LacI/PurR family transcriptional regulator
MARKSGRSSDNPTIDDIALASGVSPSTVSNVLHNRTSMMNPQTRERVLSAMREMNYRPSPVVSGMHAKATASLGVIFVKDELTEPNDYNYINEIVCGIYPAAMEQEFNVTIFGKFNWPDSRESLRRYCDGRCDGMILIAPPLGNKLIDAMYERGLPFVVAPDIETAIPHSYVDVDNELAGRMATEHLIGLGHSRIAVLTGSPIQKTAQLRTKGFLSAMESAGLADEAMVVPSEYTSFAGYTGTLSLIRESNRPTALFCSSDLIAEGALTALREKGISVPREMSVIGVDDLPAARDCDPPLTTIRQPLRAMGAEATKLLCHQIKQRSHETEQIVLPTELIVRGSTCAPFNAV